MKKQKRAQEKMESELKKMQEKLLQGGINIKDRTTQQDKEIEIKRQKLAEERLKERNVSKNAYLKWAYFETRACFYNFKLTLKIEIILKIWAYSENWAYFEDRVYFEYWAFLIIGLILKLKKGNSDKTETARRIGREC